MPQPIGLAFKAYEIEELADVYFFRPVGMVFARGARALRLTPTAVTIIGSLVGIAGGAMLYSDRLALLGFAVIILHSILDSSDGQLARMTGQVSEFGRVLDGLGGYFTHTAAYIAIAASMARGGAGGPVVALMLAAMLSSAFHAQLYDYHRTCYARTVVKGAAIEPSASGSRIAGWYEAMQRMLAGLHPRVEAALAQRSLHGAVREEDRARYRAWFYWPVRGWNAMGDNTRFYAFGVLAWLHHLDWYFLFVITAMNAAFVALWVWEWRVDRRFLAGL